MSNDLSLNYTLPKDSYIAFDALSLRQLIIDRLNTQGIFTDHTYVGSNIASIIDIVSFAFNTLIYYLNKTSTESMFTEAQLYENINRIVKVLGYKPLGYQSSIMPYELEVSGLLTDTTYTLPRYSYTTKDNVAFSFSEDVTFIRSYSNNISSTLQTVQTNYTKFLVQGKFKEYSTYIALGEPSEMMTMIVTPGTLVDHYNIHVYVKSARTSKWERFESTQSFYLETSQSTKYEIRLNGDKSYEITFGDDINGRQLQAGDIVKVIYLVSDGDAGIVGPGTFLGNTVTRYNTTTFQSILNDLLPSSTILTDSEAKMCYVTNPNSSTHPQEGESVEQIRTSAPNAFKSQFRLVNENDYKSYIKSNFNNLLADVSVINNTEYMSTYIKYYNDLGLTNPALNMRALFNQVLFSSSCNFNNVYLIVVPKVWVGAASYLLPSQKQLIKSSVDSIKIATTETVFVDPIYMAFALGVTNSLYETFLVSQESLTKLRVKKNTYTKRSAVSIQLDVANVIKDSFKQANCSLGQLLDVRAIERNILSVDGVASIETFRTDNDLIVYRGLSLFTWNPSYVGFDKAVTTGTVQLKPFQYPYLYDTVNIISKVVVV